LKRRQDIRRDEDRVGESAEQVAVGRMVCALEQFAEDRGYALADCSNCAWYGEVIDRDWDSAYTN
jgi:hypothetical protein